MLSKVLAEFLGTCGLLIVVVGSGIMGETLSQGNLAIALLANSMATGAGLYVLIQTFGPISGAHFNPAVSLAEYLWKKIAFKELIPYTLAQFSGGLIGVFITHAMFGQNLLQLSTQHRSETRLLLSEGVATLGLLMVIALSGKKNVEKTPMSVALYIMAAYWCTSSTSFANPAVTMARSFTDTFTGIQWQSAPGFILAQIVGVGFAFMGVKALLSLDSKEISWPTK